jgi:hypothetical protein
MAQLQLRRLSNEELVERLDQLRTSVSDTGLLSKSLQTSSGELLQRIKAHTEAMATDASPILAEMASAGRLQDLVEHSAKLLKLASLEPFSEASQSLISAVVEYVGEIVPLLRECHASALARVKPRRGTEEVGIEDARAALEALSSFRDDAQAILRGLRDFEELLPRHFLSKVRIDLEMESRELASNLSGSPKLLGDVVMMLVREWQSNESEVKASTAAAITGLRISRIAASSVPESARVEFERLVAKPPTVM